MQVVLGFWRRWEKNIPGRRLGSYEEPPGGKELGRLFSRSRRESEDTGFRRT